MECAVSLPCLPGLSPVQGLSLFRAPCAGTVSLPCTLSQRGWRSEPSLPKSLPKSLSRVIPKSLSRLLSPSLPSLFSLSLCVCEGEEGCCKDTTYDI